MAELSMRERMLAVIQGREHDRVPFVTYGGHMIEDLGFPSEDDVRAVVGPENVGFGRLVALYRFETPNCGFEQEDIDRGGQNGYRRTLVTPVGHIYEERFFVPALHSSLAASAACHFVKTPADYQVLMAYLRDIHVVKDLSQYRQAVAELGDYGLPVCYLPRTPYQQLWIEWVNIQDLAVHLLEHADLMADVIELIEQVQYRVFEVVCEAVREVPIPYLVFGENITAPMIGEHYFRKYCVPAYNRMAAMLEEAGQDIPLMAHMDGDTRQLWDAIGESRLRGLESMSPPPDNDTNVAEAIARWPEMRLLMNFPSSVHLTGADNVYRTAMDLLHQGARKGRLQIQISENPPLDRWRESYPAIVRAIEDFGPACAG